jgi:hypothetical protein
MRAKRARKPKKMPVWKHALLRRRTGAKKPRRPAIFCGKCGGEVVYRSEACYHIALTTKPNKHGQYDDHTTATEELPIQWGLYCIDCEEFLLGDRGRPHNEFSVPDLLESGRLRRATRKR